MAASDRLTALDATFLDGLAGGRWALVVKTHHCLVDGVGSVGIVDLLLDSEPVPRESSAPPPRQRCHPMRTGTDGCLIHRSLSARRPAQASPRLAPGRTR